VPPEKLVWVVLLPFCIVSIARAQASDSNLNGRVTDENDAPVAAARIAVRPANPMSVGRWQAQTNPAGVFKLNVPAGNYLIGVQREGYYELKDRPFRIDTALELTLVIDSVREVFQSVDVNEQPSHIDIAETSNEERLTGTEVLDVPYPNGHNLRNTLQLMTGVVIDPSGRVHFNGSSENQVQYVLNGFNLTNPISGQFQTIIAPEAVRSLDFSSARYSPEFGKGAAGVLAIRTENGTDAFHYTATDFVPGVQIQQGVRIGNWYPRIGVSGPIVRGRAWFSDTVESQFTTALITSLPPGQDTRTGWEGSNLLHAQVNLTPKNILYADFLVNLNNVNRFGLGPLDPISTTQTVHGREYFGSLKDQLYFGRVALEFGYAHNEFSNSQTPLGQSPYVFSPQGRSGNYFVTSTDAASRDQFLVHGYAPRFTFLGSHQIEAGGEGDLLRYNGDFHRTGYELLGLAGQLLSQTSFVGSGLFGVHDIDAAAWLLDTWRLSKGFQINAGVRQDWDRLVHDAGWSPRLAFSWAPLADSRTRVTGGYSITRDAVPLQPFGRVLDQTALTTTYNANGVPVVPPSPTTFDSGSGLKLPKATNWSAGVDREISTHLNASVSYLRRRGRDGFDFINTMAPDAPPSLLPLPSATAGGIFQLSNLRRDDFDSVGITVHQTFSGQHEWMASYTRSRAQSNAVLDANTLVPLQVLSSLVPMPWDAPNRILAWAYLPLPWKNWSLAALADARTGFPFSVQQQTGIISGGVDSYRYPFDFDLNVTVERIITIHGYRFALRGGVNNLTNQKNPTAVYNIIGSPQYLTFLGNEGRHFVVRLRFFEKTGPK
jgi:hypothetical protein